MGDPAALEATRTDETETVARGGQERGPARPAWHRSGLPLLRSLGLGLALGALSAAPAGAQPQLGRPDLADPVPPERQASPALAEQLEGLADALQGVRRVALLGRERAADPEIRELATRVVANVASSGWRLDTYARRRGVDLSTILRPGEPALGVRPGDPAFAAPRARSVGELTQSPPETFDATFLETLHGRLEGARERVGASLRQAADAEMTEVLASIQRQLINSRDDVTRYQTPVSPQSPLEAGDPALETP
jgi:hypothetical protein